MNDSRKKARQSQLSVSIKRRDWTRAMESFSPVSWRDLTHAVIILVEAHSDDLPQGEFSPGLVMQALQLI